MGTLSLSRNVPLLSSEKKRVRGPPWKSLGICRRVTNKGESGVGKASDRVKAKGHRPYGLRAAVRWGALPTEGLYRVPSLYVHSILSALIKRRSPEPPQALVDSIQKSKHKRLRFKATGHASGVSCLGNRPTTEPAKAQT